MFRMLLCLLCVVLAGCSNHVELPHESAHAALRERFTVHAFSTPNRFYEVITDNQTGAQYLAAHGGVVQITPPHNPEKK